jgi:hypothetical protein
MAHHCVIHRDEEQSVEQEQVGQQEYIDKVLSAYRHTPTTMGTLRHADRVIAAQLYARGVSLTVVENALILAASRRLLRAPDAPRLMPIRSLAYFLPVIEEVIELRVSPNYFLYLRDKIRRCGEAPTSR